MSSPLLCGLAPGELTCEPFAHAVRDNVLDGQRYAALSREFPEIDRFVVPGKRWRSNQAVRIPASVVVDDDRFSPAWRAFFAYHTSHRFWADIVAALGDEIRRARPNIEAAAGRPLEQWSVKRRGTLGEADVELDALFVINTPVRRQSSVRPAHVDALDKIWAGLLYMRADDDPTPGGDLAMYRFRRGRKAAFGGHYARPDDIEEVERIGFEANRFVTFVNSPISLHGVTPRPPTPHVRRYINLVAVTPHARASVPKLPPLKQATFWWQRRRIKSAPGVTLSR